jgi:alpha-tubulin suppressor-like RCC1 family protein
VSADGGENHSIALDDQGKVYCFGLNDEGQCGVGDTFGDYRKKVAEDPSQAETNLNYIQFFKRPEHVDTLPEGVLIHKVFAGKDYCYAVNTETNATYSWGLGESYVLGNKEDESVFEPFNVHPK